MVIKQLPKFYNQGITGLFIFKDAYEFAKCCDKCQKTGNITQRHEMPLTNILEVEIFYVRGIANDNGLMSTQSNYIKRYLNIELL